MGRLRGVAFIASVAGIAAALAALAHATTPGKAGMVAFTRYRLQNSRSGARFSWCAPTEVVCGGVALNVGGGGRSGALVAGWRLDRLRSLHKQGALLAVARPPRRHSTTRLSPACATTRPGEVCGDDANASFTPEGRRVVFTHAWGSVKKTALGDEIEHSAIATLDLNGNHLTILRLLPPYRG